VIWVILLFANGTAVLLFNQTLTGSVYYLALPAPPLSAPLVLNNGTPVPAVLNGSVLEVPVLGTALITVEYVPKVEAAGGILSFNVSDGLYLIWAQGGVLLLPALKVLNYTRAGRALAPRGAGAGDRGLHAAGHGRRDVRDADLHVADARPAVDLHPARPAAWPPAVGLPTDVRVRLPLGGVASVARRGGGRRGGRRRRGASAQARKEGAARPERHR